MTKLVYSSFFSTILALISLNSIVQNYSVIYTKKLGSDHIFLTDLNGKKRQLTNHSRSDSSPVISPDGNYIVFTSERIGWWKIWLMDIKKNTFKQLTNSNQAEYNPNWSPDGTKIVFVSTRTGNSNLFILDRNGHNLRQLTKSNKTDTTPSWGKDGYIYYSSQVNEVYQICRIHPISLQREVVTKTKGNKLFPQLSNNKKKILYYGDIDGNSEIYVLDIKSNKSYRLTNNPLIDIRPRWSYDDKKIVFERGNKRDTQHIYIMDSNGKNEKKLTHSNYNYAPSFVPNNIEILLK